MTSKNLENGFIDFTDVNLISREDPDAINRRSRVDGGDILMPMIGTIGNPVIAETFREYAVKNVALIKVHRKSPIDNLFLRNVMASVEMQSTFERQSSGSTQQAIVAEIEAEQAIVNANRELIEGFEKKIQRVIAKVWGEDS